VTSKPPVAPTTISVNGCYKELGDRTLENLDLVALTLERAQQAAPVLAATASVTFVDRRKQSAHPSTPSSTPCGNCGRCRHPSCSADIPARGKKCDQCGKDGHFRSVCRSAVSSKGKSSSSSSTKNGCSRQRSNSGPSRPANYVDEAHSVADGIQSVTIGIVQTSEPGIFKMVNCYP